MCLLLNCTVKWQSYENGSITKVPIYRDSWATFAIQLDHHDNMIAHHCQDPLPQYLMIDMGHLAYLIFVVKHTPKTCSCYPFDGHGQKFFLKFNNIITTQSWPSTSSFIGYLELQVPHETCVQFINYNTKKAGYYS